MRSVRVALTLVAAALAVAGASVPPLTTAGRGLVDDLSIALVVTTCAVVGVVIDMARPGHPVERLMLSGALAWGVGEALIALAVESAPLGPGAAVTGVLGTAARGVGWLALVVGLPLVFPHGRPPRRSVRLAVVAVGLFLLGSLLAPEPLEERLAGVDNPLGVPDGLRPVADLVAIGSLALAFLGVLSAVAALVRLWRFGDARERQQVQLFALAFAAPLVVLPLVATSWVEPWMFAVATLPVPVAVGVALLQRRLYDVELVASRSLTYGALSVALAGLYAVVVGGVGAMAAGRGAVWLPWVAAGVVAVAFAPLRDWLQRGANRLLYGRWSAPAEVLAETGHRLADAADGPALLQSLTDELVDGLGVETATIADREGRVLTASGTAPTAGGTDNRLELTAYGSAVGSLTWTGPPLREREQRLLEDVARQVGGVVHSAALVEELRSAQERLVGAREQERRRLRRDLHDGLGPALAGLGFQVDTIGNLVREGRPVEEQLDALQHGLRATVGEVRRIVDGLRPPALDTLGLFDAVAELGVDLVSGAGLDLDLDLPPVRPVLPAAVEVVAYRVAQEALTNVVRHAGATTCRLSARLTDDLLSLEVSDDGRGTGATRPTPATGVGLRSMRERADEIGGSVDVCDRGPGIRVSLRLPLRAGLPS